MKRKRFAIIASICIVLFGIVNIYAEGQTKNVTNAVASIVLVCASVLVFFRDDPTYKRIYRRLYELFGPVISKPDLAEIKPGDDIRILKSRVLAFTNKLLNGRVEDLRRPDIYKYDFGLNFVRREGSTREHFESIRLAHNENKPFVFITGNSGSGKTFELIKRASIVCDALQLGGVAGLGTASIPLYIELKSLDGELTHEWIAQYIVKTNSIISSKHNTGDVGKYKAIDYGPFRAEDILFLLENNAVTFFIDGLDEIPHTHRPGCLMTIIGYSKKTAVSVSCRKYVFDELVKEGRMPDHGWPVEDHFEPLDKRQIDTIVQNVPRIASQKTREMIAFIDQKPNLGTQLSRPIMLNLFILTFSHLADDEKSRLSTSDEQETMKIMWERYEDQIARSKVDKDTDIMGLRTYSAWIAKIMQDKSFSVESIQPFWLKKVDKGDNVVPDRGLQCLYYVVTRMLAALSVGIAMGFIIASPLAFISVSLLGGLVIALIAGIYKMEKPWIKPSPRWARVLLSVFMFAFLLVICAVYQGVSVPRAFEDMHAAHFSYIETWPGIVLGIALSTIFIYRVISEKQKGQYILPKEKFGFNLRYVLVYALIWGLLAGLVSGSVGLWARYRFANSLFIRQWLVPFIRRVLGRWISDVSDLLLSAAIFAYPFLITSIVAFVIIALVAARYNDDPVEEKIKQQLNYGIRQSLLHAALHGGFVFLSAAGLYLVIMLLLASLSWLFCFKIAAGIGLLAFLWYGGLEVINHWILRICLWIRGISPLSYDEWVERQKHMGIITPSGYKMNFYHASINEYYQRMPMSENPRVRLVASPKKDRFMLRVGLVTGLLLLFLPFVCRYVLRGYWQSPREVITHSNYMRMDEDSVFTVGQNGLYAIKASGMVNVGTFVGYVFPGGTTFGFMGIPIDSAYNLPGMGRYRHAALLMRIQSGQRWKPYQYVAQTKKPMYLAKGDKVEFLVNDREFQNNFWHFAVTVNLLTDTSSTSLR